jgi:Holliday junction resolvasome RuvABC ATP-dependent DNA helicase subunit
MSGLDDFIGQTAIKDLIRAKVRVVQATATTLPHLLLCGEKQQGKITLAAAVAAELTTSFTSVSAESLAKVLDLTSLLSNVRYGQIVAVSDIESLQPSVLDHLVEAVSTFRVHIVVGVGPGARAHILPTPKFGFVFTTSKPWLVAERLRRWCIPCEFASYSQEEAAQIVLGIAQKKGLQIDADAASHIATRCQHKPGEAEVFLQKVANHFSFSGSDLIDRSQLAFLDEFLGSGGLYPNALSMTDRIRQMPGVEFEHWAAQLFRNAGFLVETTPASGDHGIDLLIRAGGHVTAVQCKRWEGTVGEPVVRDLYGAMMAANAQSGCLITTASFTAQALAFAKDKPLYLVGLDLLLEAAKSPEALTRALR